MGRKPRHSLAQATKANVPRGTIVGVAAAEPWRGSWRAGGRNAPCASHRRGMFHVKQLTLLPLRNHGAGGSWQEAVMLPVQASQGMFPVKQLSAVPLRDRICPPGSARPCQPRKPTERAPPAQNSASNGFVALPYPRPPQRRGNPPPRKWPLHSQRQNPSRSRYLPRVLPANVTLPSARRRATMGWTR